MENKPQPEYFTTVVLKTAVYPDQCVFYDRHAKKKITTAPNIAYALLLAF